MKNFLKYNIETQIVKSNENYAKFLLKPLEQGFGNTIGNALRRICLSNIPGTAMFAIKIDGITHEYQAMDGVYDDITQIILNLKRLVIKIDSNIVSDEELDNTPIEKWPVLKIQKDKIGEIYAKDIETPPGFTIVNKDLYITKLTDDVKFDLEIFAKNGRGFKSFKDNRAENGSLQIIATDSDFSSVTKFAYHVEEIKVSKFDMNDELTIELSTNGSIKAMDALILASKILVEHLNIIINLNESIKNLNIMDDQKIETKKVYLSTPIEELNLSVRAYNALKGIQINTIQELVDKTSVEIDKIKNLGKKSVLEIKEEVHNRGLKLKDE